MPEFMVALEGRHLGEPGTPETLRAHLRELPASDVIQMATKIMSVLEGQNGPSFLVRQFKFLELFSPEAAVKVDRLLSQTSGNGGVDTIFFPGQLLTLMKLAASICDPGPPIGSMNAVQMSHFLLAAVQVNDVRDTAPGIAPHFDTTDLLAAVVFSFRNAEQNRHIDVRASTGRAVQLWLNRSRPWPESLQDPEAFCMERFGVSLSRFIAIASAPPFQRMQPDFKDPGSVLFTPERFFAQTQIDVETTTSVIDALTFEPGPGDPITAQATYWSLVDLAARPLFRCGTEARTASSLRYGLERATTGVFWMLHASHEGSVGPFTEHFGFLFEDYCVNVARGMVKGTLTVSGDIPYGPRARRVRSSDLLISTQSTVRNLGAHVFIECRAGRPRREVFESGSVDAFGEYLADVTRKLGQLDLRIRDHVNGEFEIPDDIAGRDDTYVPMLVLDEPFQWTPALGQLLDDEVRNRRLFRPQNVANVVVCGVSEFEYLVGACEHGADLLDLLLGYLQSGRASGLDEYVHARTGPLQVPRFAEQGWETWGELMRSELFGVLPAGRTEESGDHGD